MDGLFRLREEQVERIKPFCPKSRGVSRVDDRKVVSGIIHVLRSGLRSRGSPAACRPCKTLTNPFRRWSEKGIFQLIFEPRLMGCTKGGLTSKRPVVCDGKGQPVRLLLSEGQCSDFSGAEVLLRDLTEASVLLGDKGCDSNKIRTMVLEQGITPCIPSGRNRNEWIPYSKRLYKMRHRVENLLARLKDWRRTTTRYDRCAHIFLSAALLAATLIFW